MSAAKPMDFKQAVEYMDPMQVTDYLQKTFDFLTRNNDEICFPSISPYVEAFLVNLVKDTRNLMCKSFSDEDKKIALEIIEVLEMSKDVFRWSHTYQCGKQTKNLLVYKKIYTNKITMKPTKPSTVAHRLIQAQAPIPATPTPTPPSTLVAQKPQPVPTNPSEPNPPLISSGFKLHILNKTLRFIKDESETVLVYDEMASYQAEYINSLFKQSDNDVGFGYKSLYAPLWEAMELHGVNYKFEMALEANGKRNSILKLKKIPRNNRGEVKNHKEKGEEKATSVNHSLAKNESAFKNTSACKKNTNEKLGQSLNTSICSESSTQSAQSSNNSNSPKPTKTGKAPELALLDNVGDQFVQNTVRALTEFAEDASRASITLERLSDDEMAFVKKVKGLAASKESRDMCGPRIRNLLVNLNCSIVTALKSFKITTTVNGKDGGITLKKTPLFTASAALPSGIQFRKAGNPITENIETVTDKETATDKATPQTTERKTTDKGGINKRTAKLLEDMSTPVESDKGIRMMLLMGWKGGALGARGEGIVEPIMPAIDLPSKAGLGHVPPPKAPQPRRPADFRMMLLHNIQDLLLHEEKRKEVQYKEPLTKKENKFLRSALICFNAHRRIGLVDKEGELAELILKELKSNPRIELRAGVSEDLKTLTLIKVVNICPKPIKPVKIKNERPKAPRVINPDEEVILITLLDVEEAMPHVNVPKNKIKDVRKAAVRLAFLFKIAYALCVDKSTVRFLYAETMSRKLMTFLRAVIDSVNRGVWNDILTPGCEENVYMDILAVAQGYTLSLDFVGLTVFTLTKTPVFDDEPQCFDDTKVFNSKKADNQSKIQAKVIKQIKSHDSSQEENNVVENNVNYLKLVKAIEKSKENYETDDNIYKNNIESHKTIGKDLKEIKIENDENHNIKITILNDNFNIGNTINCDTDSKANKPNLTDSRNDIMRKSVEVKIDATCDIVDLNDKTGHVIINNEAICSNGTNDSKAAILVHEKTESSDLNRDIRNLETEIIKTDIDCNINNENDSESLNPLDIALLKPGLVNCIKKEKDTETGNSDLDMSVSETELSVTIKEVKDADPSLYHKRSRTNSISSQELKAKRSKIASDENMVIILPKNSNEKISEDIAREFQVLISAELDKSKGFLPLINCYGIEKGRLIYGCHDNDDVAWLKNIISAANLELEVRTDDDLCLDKKSRTLVIKINSFIPLDTRKTLKNLEQYNAGLNTKCWKVLSKLDNSDFVLFIVEVDEKSLKYITEENFSLYCGLDKAQFSIIF